MNKNYMSEIAKMLGVNIGEEFIIQNADRKENVILAMDGLRIPFPHGMAEMDDGRLLLEVLQGHYEIIKLPWEPKDTEFYWTMFLQVMVSHLRVGLFGLVIALISVRKSLVWFTALRRRQRNTLPKILKS